MVGLHGVQSGRGFGQWIIGKAKVKGSPETSSKQFHWERNLGLGLLVTLGTKGKEQLPFNSCLPCCRLWGSCRCPWMLLGRVQNRSGWEKNQPELEKILQKKKKEEKKKTASLCTHHQDLKYRFRKTLRFQPCRACLDAGRTQPTHGTALLTRERPSTRLQSSQAALQLDPMLGCKPAPGRAPHPGGQLALPELPVWEVLMKGFVD